MMEKSVAPKEGSKGHGGSFIATYIYMPPARAIAKFLAENTRITPIQVTLYGFILGMIGIGLLTSRNIWIILLGCVMMFVQNVLDCVDGNLARRTGRGSKTGGLLDEFLDRIFENTLFFAVTWVAFERTGEWWVWAAGFFAAVGTARMNMLHLKLESMQQHGKSIRTLPLWRQVLNYNGDNNLAIIMLGALTGNLDIALVIVAVATNIYAFGRFFYVISIWRKEENPGKTKSK